MDKNSLSSTNRPDLRRKPTGADTARANGAGSRGPVDGRRQSPLRP